MIAAAGSDQCTTQNVTVVDAALTADQRRRIAAGNARLDRRAPRAVGPEVAAGT